MEIAAIEEKLNPVFVVKENAGIKMDARMTLVMVVMSDKIDSLFVASPSLSSLMMVRMNLQ